MLIDWLTVSDRLPQASVAHQLRVVVIEHPVPVVTVVESSVTVEQLSLAVGAWNKGVPLQAMVLFGPWPPIVGAVRSTSVITADVVAVLPHWS